MTRLEAGQRQETTDSKTSEKQPWLGLRDGAWDQRAEAGMEERVDRKRVKGAASVWAWVGRDSHPRLGKPGKHAKG